MRTPCIVFTGHPSLRFGSVVHFLELWGKSNSNTIIFTGRCLFQIPNQTHTNAYLQNLILVTWRLLLLISLCTWRSLTAQLTPACHSVKRTSSFVSCGLSMLQLPISTRHHHSWCRIETILSLNLWDYISLVIVLSCSVFSAKGIPTSDLPKSRGHNFAHQTGVWAAGSWSSCKFSWTMLLKLHFSFYSILPVGWFIASHWSSSRDCRRHGFRELRFPWQPLQA
jgi:hypothetical protein